MPTPIITFTSAYGSTREYAEELAARSGTEALGYAATAEALAAAPTAPLVVLGPVHGPVNAGAKFLTDSVEPGSRRVALCTVGMTLDELAVAKDGAAKALGAKAGAVTRFYLPGRLNYSELSTTDRATMWTVVKLLKAKPRKSDNDRMMIDTFDTDVDRVDLDRLDAVQAWLRQGS